VHSRGSRRPRDKTYNDSPKQWMVFARGLLKAAIAFSFGTEADLTTQSSF